MSTFITFLVAARMVRAGPAKVCETIRRACARLMDPCKDWNSAHVRSFTMLIFGSGN